MPPKTFKADDAQTVVLDYLNKEYRPYSTNDIFQNLHGAVPKAAVGKALEVLAEKGQIITKLFGKTGISMAKKAEVGSQMEAEKALQKEINILTEDLDCLEGEIAELQETHHELVKYPDDNALQSEIAELNASIKDFELKLKGSVPQSAFSEDRIKAIKQTVIDVTKEMEKRSKLYKNLIGLFSEHIDPNKLIQTLGLEVPDLH